MGSFLLGLVRWRLQGFLIFVLLAAIALAWGMHAWRVRQADDSHLFEPHENMAAHQAFLHSVASEQVREAEQKAGSDPANRQHWEDEAARRRARAAAHARSETDHRRRSGLKEHLRRGGW